MPTDKERLDFIEKHGLPVFFAYGSWRTWGKDENKFKTIRAAIDYAMQKEASDGRIS